MGIWKEKIGKILTVVVLCIIEAGNRRSRR